MVLRVRLDALRHQKCKAEIEVCIFIAKYCILLTL